MSDSHKWEFRPPPAGIAEGDLYLCTTPGQCRLGVMCPQAHSPGELLEWRARKVELVKQQMGNSSYTDKILKEVLSVSSSAPPTTHNIPGVKVVLDQKDSLKFSKRNASTAWNLFLCSNYFLRGISMLEVENLQHFSITDVKRVRNGNATEIPSSMKECAIEDSDIALQERPGTLYNYRLKLNFATKVFGAFKQTLIFDFGTKPLLAKSVNVTVAPESAEDDLQSAKESILTIAPVWDDSNSTIQKFSPAQAPIPADEKDLLDSYPIPQPESFQLTKVCIDKTVTVENYRERFHQLLYMEELAQYQEITGFNATLNILTLERYLFTENIGNVTTAKYSRVGELFGRIDLNSELADDSKAGRLILTKCSSVLLKLFPVTRQNEFDKKKMKGKKINKMKKKFQENDDRKAWECIKEDTAKSVIYVRLPADLVTEHELKKDTKLLGDIQFKLNRLALTEMHYAVDRLQDPSLVYPAVTPAPTIPWSPSTQWGATLDPQLNVKQKEAVLAITTPLGNRLPPILIIGPYGTGKTFTIGAALLMLLRDTMSKILVCTHSNSAADLYIKDYIHPAILKGDINKKVLRIYYQNRWVSTVNETVQNYCLIGEDPLTGNTFFRRPGLDDLENVDLVVATLSTSRSLAQLLKPGHFSHILLDEAAQALETEAIIPLILANNLTRIVLAGDHMQLEPEIVSTFAVEKGLNISLLERLYDHYPSDHPCKILLCENYRSHEGIVDFTSELFYDQKLVSSGRQPPHPKWFPLTFFTARGEDVQDSNSTSFYNNYEVAEIADRLIELKRTWPEVWGKKEDVEVGVVTPYVDQVQRLRNELRKKKLHNISVERVQNVQGKQYRVIFISIVRTRDSCLSKEEEGRTDFGFLSSAKLLNTALTRAQSLVAVVGDPVTMCSVGRCRTLWQRFLEICSNHSSLFGYTWAELNTNLAAIELKNIYGLNPLAKEFIPRVQTSFPMHHTPFPMPMFPPPPPHHLSHQPHLQRHPLAHFAGTQHRPAVAQPMGPAVPPPPRTSLAMLGAPRMHPTAAFPMLSPPVFAAAVAARGGLLSPTPPSHSPMHPGVPFMPPFSTAPMRPIIPIMNHPQMSIAAAAFAFRPQVSVIPSHLQQHQLQQPNQLQQQHLPVKAEEKLPFNQVAGPHGSVPDPNRILQQQVSRKLFKPENATERILPPGSDLQTILQNRAAQENWFNFLISVGKLQEAQAFEELILSEGASALSPNNNIVERNEHENNGNYDPRDAALNRDGRNIKHENGADRTVDQEKDEMRLMLENLMDDERDSKGENTNAEEDYIPLYLRRGNTQQQHQQQQQQRLQGTSFENNHFEQQQNAEANIVQNHAELRTYYQQELSSNNGYSTGDLGQVPPEVAVRDYRTERVQQILNQKLEQMSRANREANQSINHGGNQLINQTGNQSISQAGDQSINHFGNQPNNESGNSSTPSWENKNSASTNWDMRTISGVDWEIKKDGASSNWEMREETVGGAPWQINNTSHSFDNGSDSNIYQLPTFRPATNVDWKEDLTEERLDFAPPLGDGSASGSAGGAHQMPSYARVVQTTTPRGQEEDQLTKIRNLGTLGFQHLG